MANECYRELRAQPSAARKPGWARLAQVGERDSQVANPMVGYVLLKLKACSHQTASEHLFFYGILFQ